MAGVTEYKANGEVVKLSPDTIRKYIVSGNGKVTDQEITMFLGLCKYQHLNPFLREAYLIKYGDRNPATMVVGKDVFLKRAKRNPDFAGMQAGIMVMKQDGRVGEREGTYYSRASGEVIVGGWAKVYIKGYEHPIYASVSLDEYAGRKSDGSLNGQWASKTATMIRKVALVQALREAFPDDLGALHDQAEMTAVSAEKLDDTPIEVHVEEQKGEEEHEQSDTDRTIDEGRRDEVYARWSGDREPDFGSPEEPEA